MISETLKQVQPVAHAKAIGKSKVTFRGEGAVKVKAVYIELVFWLPEVSKGNVITLAKFNTLILKRL